MTSTRRDGERPLGGVWRRIPVPGEHVAGIAAGWVLQRPVRFPRWSVPLGWLVALAGGAIGARAVRERQDADIDRPEHLAVDGLHGVTRNPMYVGWSLIHLGVGLAGRAPWVVAAWPASVAVLHRAILREEMELAELFGEEYADYRARVPRYLGRK